jgi:hypothetical protein
MARLIMPLPRNGIAMGVIVNDTAWSGTNKASLASPALSASYTWWPPVTPAPSALDDFEQGVKGTRHSTSTPIRGSWRRSRPSPSSTSTTRWWPSPPILSPVSVAAASSTPFPWSGTSTPLGGANRDRGGRAQTTVTNGVGAFQTRPLW